MLWVQCGALFLLLHHEMAGAGGSGFESPNAHTSRSSKASPYQTPLLHKNLPGLPASICPAFKCSGCAGEGDKPRAWLRELHGAVLGYFVGESLPPGVGVTHMGTTGHSDEPQTCRHQEHGPGEGPSTAATLTQLHSFYMGKHNSMETGRFNGVGSVAFHSFFTESA